MQKSERADAKSGIAVGESEERVVHEFGDPAAAEETIVVGQALIVLDSTLCRPIDGRDVSGGVGPSFDRFREAVVHLESEDSAITAMKEENGQEKYQEEEEAIHSIYVESWIFEKGRWIENKMAF